MAASAEETSHVRVIVIHAEERSLHLSEFEPTARPVAAVTLSVR